MARRFIGRENQNVGAVGLLEAVKTVVPRDGFPLVILDFEDAAWKDLFVQLLIIFTLVIRKEEQDFLLFVPRRDCLLTDAHRQRFIVRALKNVVHGFKGSVTDASAINIDFGHLVSCLGNS